MNLKETYNKIAEDWHEDHKSDDWWIEGTDVFTSFLKSGNKVLDVGCGGGIKSKYLVDKGFKVLGIDFSENLIDIAKQEVPKAEFLVMDMRDLADLPREFDGVFAQASLLHIPKKDVFETIKTFSSKLKPGGYLYIAVKELRPNSPDEEIKEEDDYGYSYSRFFSYYTRDELKKYFRGLGLELVYENIEPVRNRWIQIIGKKKS